MNRFDTINGVVVRYDGTETRVHVNRHDEFDGLSVKELSALVVILQAALKARKRFDSKFREGGK